MSQKLRTSISFIVFFNLSFSCIAQLTITVNEGKELTNSSKIQISLNAIEAVEMLISEDVDFTGASWVPFQTRYVFTLDAQDGEHFIFVKTRKASGEESNVAAKKIRLDTSAPTQGFANVTLGSYLTSYQPFELETFAKGATHMMVSNNADFLASSWVEYRRYITWRVPTGEGLKKIYVKYKDEAGNETEPILETVTVDLTPPQQGEIKVITEPIKKDPLTGLKVTNQDKNRVNLEIYASEAKYMMLSNDFGFFGARWQTYNEFVEDWQLPADSDGTYPVFIKFKDIAQNESRIYSDTIIVDTRPPYGSRIRVNQGKKVTDNPTVSLDVYSADAQEVMFSTNPAFGGVNWEPYRRTKTFDLPNEDKVHTVYASFKDAVGNVSAPAQASIRLDNTPPQNGSITIISDEPFTLQDKATVRVKATDAVQMQISTDSTFKDAFWRNYQPTNQKILLGNEYGTKTIYARFKDGVGNISTLSSDTIIYANEPTLCNISIKDNLRFCTDPKKQVEVMLAAKNATEMQINNTEDFKGVKWEPYVSSKLWTLSGEDGEKRIFARYKSTFDVVSDVVETRIILDRSTPKGVIILNNGKAQTLQSLINVELKAEGADFMQVGFSSDLSDSPWQRYNPNIKLDLGVTKGDRFVYARFKDYADNTSKIVSDTVSYAILTVRNSLTINDDKGFTNHPNGEVKLRLRSRNATEMKVSNFPTFEGASWESFAPEKSWNLIDADGKKVVYAIFRSSTNTESEIETDTIILDRLPPVGNLTLKLREDSDRTSAIDVIPESPKAVLMQLSETTNFDGRYWEAYREGPLKLKFQKRGKKIIYARYRDAADNISEITSDTVTLIIFPFAADFTINNGKQYCTHPDKEVSLSLFCRDATEMLISQDKRFAGAKWEPYQTQRRWKLEGEDGRKTVYVKFRSETLTESGVIQKSIELDRNPPQHPQILINKGDESTLDAYITVAVKAEGAMGMQVSLNKDFEGEVWRNYSEGEFRMELPQEGGKHTIYARFRDQNQNISATATDEILLEIIPLETQFSIENGAEYATAQSREVTLQLFARGATEVLISNRENFTQTRRWEPYREEIKWKLSEGDGEKQVFVKFRSKTATESSPLSDAIILDTQPPVNCNFTVEQSTWTEASRVKIKASATDASFMQFSEDVTFTEARWQPYTDATAYFRVSGEDGSKTIYARFKDNAGNISRIIRKSYQLDTQAPLAEKFLINDGENDTNEQEVMLTLQLNGSETGVSEMRIANKESAFREDLPWRPYAFKSPWELADYDGTHQVFAQLKDEAGNVSNIFNTSVNLDRSPPAEGSFSIREGEFCNHPARIINLNFSAFNATRLMVANKSDFSDGTWERIKPERRWQLTQGEGLKTVYVKFGDEAGNTTPTVSQTILLDTTPPTAEIIINNGEKVTNNPTLSLQFRAEGEAKKMLVGFTPSFKGKQWEAFAMEKELKIPANNGNKTVYARFMDNVGNISTLLSATITLDMQPPVPTLMQVNIPPNVSTDNLIQVEDPNVTLFLKAKGANFVKIANSKEGLEFASWLPFLNTPTKDWMEIEWQLSKLNLQAVNENRNPTWSEEQVGIQGEMKTIFYQLKDNTENESAVFTKQVMLYAPKPMEVFIWKWQ